MKKAAAKEAANFAAGQDFIFVVTFVRQCLWLMAGYTKRGCEDPQTFSLLFSSLFGVNTLLSFWPLSNNCRRKTREAKEGKEGARAGKGEGE